MSELEKILGLEKYKIIKIEERKEKKKIRSINNETVYLCFK